MKPRCCSFAIIRLALVTLLCVVTSVTLRAINVGDTRLLTQPAIAKTQMAFVYAGDLWVAGLDGRNVRRLTSGQGVTNPAFSPDGSLIAFSAQYEGNSDVYLVPSEGGVPTRLTWHPRTDLVQGFTPDGSAVLFTSPRASFTGRYTQLFTVPVRGGFPAALPIPHASRASYSPDGKRIAYNPLYDAFSQWKGYRGGTHSTISLFNLSDHSVEKIPQLQGRANDADPMWVGDTVYFRSDRNGEFNLFAYDTRTRQIRQLTHHGDFPVLTAAAGPAGIVYEQAGYLHRLDPGAAQSARLVISAPTDLIETRPRFVKGAKYIRNASLSPSGARAVFEFRGEIVTMPAEKGDPRNLTNTPAAHERWPIWSPDGKSIAYFSDLHDEYALHVRNQDGKGEPKVFKLPPGFYDLAAWSPDSRKISFSDQSWSLYWIDLETGAVKKIGSEYVYGPRKLIRHVWSPDSQWLIYTLGSQPYTQAVHAYSIERDTSSPVTDGMSDVSDPVFDQSGKYLYFFASTDAGPVRDWFAMSTADMRATRAIYLAVLRKDLPSPIAKQSDEEKGTPKETKPGDERPIAEDLALSGQPQDQKDDQKAKKSEEAAAPEKFSIDLDGINQRILALPIPPADFSRLQAGAQGQIYFLKTADEKTALHRYDLNERKDETLLSDVNDYIISGDAKKLLYRSKDTWTIATIKPKLEPGEGKLPIDNIEVQIDPRAEWKQIFDEAWRINRDYFYAPNMHGVDWNAMRRTYATFLPDLATRDDLNRVIQWMSSELGVGHHRVGGGDYRVEPKTVPGGLLGADYTIENGRYRFKKVYGGLNWNPDLRSPLTEPGVDVKAGEYLLAVSGKDLRPPTNLYSMFENTADKIIEITVGPNPDGTGARTVQVVPIANEAQLRNRDWVEGNLKKVHDATGGRVAYVYVPNTAGLGHTYFKRYFYPQAHKDAIIVDERFNGGGQVADYYIDMLRRPLISNWATRYGADFKTPGASIQGPKVMIIDETAGSGGDLLPWMFRRFKLGPLVGKRTWGGLVGTLGFPALMDGGFVTAPNLAIWTEDGWVVENEGVPPDIEVEQTPAAVIAGRDPQLERAIQVVMDELKRNPPPKLKRPPYPEKMRKVITSSSK